MAQSANNRFVEIGRIGKPRGLDGIVRFLPTAVFTDDLLDPDHILYMRNNRSDLIPVRTETVQTEMKKNQQSFFVKFDTIANRNEAEMAMNKALFVERVHIYTPEPVEEEISLTGYSVHFENREIGRVLDVIENPAHPILEVKYGSGSLLIPYVDEFIEEADHEKATIFCRNLDQLTDL